MMSGKYDMNYSKFVDGVSLLCEKGRKPSAEEFEAAEAMVGDGIRVWLTSESNPEQSTSKTHNGNLKFADGRVSSHALTYEQRTPTSIHKDGAHITIKKALEHAKSKRAEVAVIYDRNGLFHRGDIVAGIREYERYDSNAYRFKAIVVIDKNKRVHEHGHSQ